MPQTDLRARLAQLKANRNSGGAYSSNVFSPMARGGLFRPGTIQPIVYGEEIALVKQRSALCLGKIGAGGNVCLKLSNQCDTEAHMKKKGELPDDPCLIQLKGDKKGYENVVLEAELLEQAFIDELLSRENVSWPSEFAKIRTSDTRSVIDREVVERAMTTSKKHKDFRTPGKLRVTEDILDKINLLGDMHSLLIDMGEPTFNQDGEEISRSFAFEETNYKSFCNTVFDKLDVITENSRCMSDVVLNFKPFIESTTEPIEDLVTGLRLEFASLEGQIGLKTLERKDIPPVVWNAVEHGFDSMLKIDERLDEVTGMAKEAHDVASALLQDQEDALDTNVKFDSETKEKDGKSFIKSISAPTLIDGHLFHPSKSGGRDRENGNLHRGTDCDADATMCGRCMAKFHEVDNQIIATNIRVSNLEDSKNGNIDSAVMVKDRIYRGRGDVAAELDRWFPSAAGRKIDAGLFPTPHLILNLIHADICSKKAPKIPLDQKDLIKLEIRRSDADAFYALQSDKPEFLITNELCPNFNYKANKTQRDSAPIRFLPSHDDFGNGLDSDSLHFKFKSSLDHIRGERERYIESRLMDHPDHRVLSIAKQLLDDSCKFISQMLSFMDEIYASCVDSFGATTEAWELVCHCIEEVFTKELKPSLKYCVAQDLVDVRDALIGVVHSAFSLNCKVRELTAVGLKNHHSTTTSHVRFVMKMAKSSRKAETKNKASGEKTAPDTSKLQSSINSLEKENKELKSHLKRLESRLDSYMAKMNQLSSDSPGKTKRSKNSEPKDDESKE